MTDELDIADLRGWIGRQETSEDLVTHALVERFAATVGCEADLPDGAAPRLIHFCLCQPAAPMDSLGPDGHPARGGFLPPVPLPRRMWAGSDIVFHGDLRIGDTVQRRSTIANVEAKQGRTGVLCFVTVDHVYTVGGETRVTDRQTLVYRALQAAAAGGVAVAPDGDVVATIDPSPTLLFRYSALTFNGHRIHYDAPYATAVEGYPGLVVHGPLQATVLLNLAAGMRGRAPDAFRFQSLSTLYDRDPMRLNGTDKGGDGVSLWTAAPQGPVAMRAEAQWR